VKGQRILRAVGPAYVRKESQGVLVIRATANKSLTSVLSGGLCCARCLSNLSVSQRSLVPHPFVGDVEEPLSLKHM
jgi:hypothetical protein